MVDVAIKCLTQSSTLGKHNVSIKLKNIKTDRVLQLYKTKWYYTYVGNDTNVLNFKINISQNLPLCI